MASCNAQDVQLKAYSPPFRRSRETRKGSKDENYCEAEANGGARCPPGYCACSGELRKKIVTPEHPWGAPDTAVERCQPPRLTQDQMDAAGRDADARRAAMRSDVIPAVEALVQKARGSAHVLGEDEAERLRELEEWVAVLKAE